MPLALQGSAKGVLHAVAWHGGGGGGHPKTAPARGWKEPHGMAVGFPVLAEQREGRLGQRHIAVLRPFAVAHVDDHAGTINIGHLQVGTFLQPQATGIDGA